MSVDERKSQAKIDALVQQLLTNIKKTNIRVKTADNKVIVKSSIFRFKLIVDLFILFGLIQAFFRLDSDTVWFPLSLFVIYFLYSIWEDTQAINNIKIDVCRQKLSIRHLNIFRYFLLKLLFRYKNEYSFEEIKSFEVKEKFHFKSIYRKNYVLIFLSDHSSYITLHLPDMEQAEAVKNFLNAIIKIKVTGVYNESQ